MFPRRHGDIARSEQHPVGWVHGNTTLVPALIKSAVKSVGQGVTNIRGSNGIDSTRRTLDDLIAVAALSTNAFSRSGQRLYDELMTARPAAMVIARGFESTPVFMKFGKWSVHSKILADIQSTSKLRTLMDTGDGNLLASRLVLSPQILPILELIQYISDENQ